MTNEWVTLFEWRDTHDNRCRLMLSLDRKKWSFWMEKYDAEDRPYWDDDVCDQDNETSISNWLLDLARHMPSAPRTATEGST